jgi:integrase
MVRSTQPKPVLQSRKATARALRKEAAEPKPKKSTRKPRIANLSKEFLDELRCDYLNAVEGRKQKKKGHLEITPDLERPKRVRFTDLSIEGLAVEITYRGRITWRLRVPQKDGPRQTWIKIGRYPGMTPEAAREEAQAIIGSKIPASEHRRAKNSKLFKEIAEEWIKCYVEVELAPETLKSYNEFLKYYIYPELERKHLEDITAEYLTDWHTKLTKNNGKTTADAVIRVLSSLLTWASSRPRNYVKYNLAKSINKNGPNTIHAPLDDSGLKKVGTTIENLLITREINPLYLFACLVAMVTGWRRSSIAKLTWDALIFEDNIAVLFFHKSRRKRGPIPLPIEEFAISLFRQIPKVEGCPYVFPGKAPDSHVAPGTLSAIWKRVRERAGVKSSAIQFDENGKRKFLEVRFHDLRHTIGAFGAKEGTLKNVATLLGQSGTGATERYTEPVPSDQHELKQKIEQRVAKSLGQAPDRFSKAMNLGNTLRQEQEAATSSGGETDNGALPPLSGEPSPKPRPQQKTSDRCPPKEELQRLVLEIPVTKIAEERGVSEAAVRKWCRRLGVITKRTQKALAQ